MWFETNTCGFGSTNVVLWNERVVAIKRGMSDRCRLTDPHRTHPRTSAAAYMPRPRALAAVITSPWPARDLSRTRERQQSVLASYT
ncbi:hypothetical protein RJ55_01129 [Drechmeria coniospora]|nr:hypothetical protein RJ55_01129 [Drechmeria coniospora]